MMGCRREQGNAVMATMPDWLKQVRREAVPKLRDIFILSLIVNLLALASPVFVLQVYDRVVFHNGLATLAGLAVGMVIVLAGDYLFRLARARILQRVALEVDIALSRRLTDAFLNLPLAELESRPAATWQQAFRDVETVRNAISGGAATLITELPYVVLFLGLIALVANAVLWVVLAFVAVFAILAVVSGRAITDCQADERRAQMARDRLLAETIQGRGTVKALGLEPFLRPALERAQADHIGESLSRGATTDRMAALAHTLTMASTVAVIGFGALAILTQNLTMGGLIAGNMLASRLLQPLNQLVGTWRALGATRAAAERLNALFAIAPERRDSDLLPAEVRGDLGVDHLTFRYGPALQPVFPELTLGLSPGGITAVVGPNGSGKTTLLKILLGLYAPQEGRVLLDGGDLRQYGRADIARWIGYAPQETFLLSGSIKDNILATHPGATDDEVREAARLAGLDEIVRALPQGYATGVGEAGTLMSGGVRQRIGLARAFLTRPRILLLDEPTSNLDSEAEGRLRQSLIALARERTVVVVSHSPVLLTAARDVVAILPPRGVLFGPAAKILPLLVPRGTEALPPGGERHG